jgi:hypothetical protein
MAIYEFKVEIEGVDVSDAIIAPFTITNGRRNFNQGMAQWSANLQSFKTETNTILATAGLNIDVTGAGSKIEILVYDSVISDYVTMFRGVITSTSSTANTYSWSAIDEVFFALSNAEEVSSPTGAQTLDSFISNLMSAAKTPFAADAFFFGSPWPGYGAPATTRGDISNWIQEVASLAPYAFLTLFPPDSRTFSSLINKTFVMRLDEFDTSTIDLEITDGSINLSFSTDRDAADVFNSVSVLTNVPASDTVLQDATSIKKLGIKQKIIESYFLNLIFVGGSYKYRNSKEAAEALATSFIQQSSPFGYPLINFTTSYDRVDVPGTKSPKEVFLGSLPGKTIDSSAVTEPTFQQKMVVQQVRHLCSPDNWEIELLAANYRYASEPQTWDEVTSNLEWDDVPAYLTWDMIAVKEI